MPNWCNNFITISGDKEKMKPIYDFFNDNKDTTDTELLVMNTLIPHDEEYRKIEESGDFLLNPQTSFYGTKWDFSLVEANVNQLDEDCITFAPQTAWAPPSEFCRRLTAKYGVDVTISFDEPGIGFIGEEEFADGEMIGQIMYDDYLEGMYRLQPDAFWDNEVFNTMEYNKEEGKTFEEVLQENFSFITKESEIKQLKEAYDEIEVDE
jgi:hypothetical protein